PQAEAQLAECLKIDPNNTSAGNDLAYLWAEQNKNLPEAEALIRRAIEQDRKSRQDLLRLGPPRAEKEVRDNACYLDSLGWILYRPGQADAARQALQHAAALPDGDDRVIGDTADDVYAQ